MNNRESTRTERAGELRDRGVSLIEVLIAIVLLGTVVAATLTSLTVTINASALDRDHANAHAWLQTGADMLYARDPIECDSLDSLGNPMSLEDIKAAYQDTVRQTDNPEDWGASNITVTDLQFWSIYIDADGQGTEEWLTTCNAEATNLQKVALRVTAEDGRIVEEVEVIIGG